VQSSAAPAAIIIKPAHLSVDSAQARIADVRRKLSQWNVEWGPIHQWPRFFENALSDAKEEGRSGQWVEEVQLVVDEGRKLVQELHQAVDGCLPIEEWMVRDLWRSCMSLNSHLSEGITVLETRLEIVAPFPHEKIGRYSVHYQ
jgi:hypothetical protein